MAPRSSDSSNDRRRLLRQERLTRAFYELGKELSEARTSHEIALVSLRAADELIGWDAAYLNLYSEEENCVIAVATFDTLAGEKQEFPPSERKTPPSNLALKVLRDGPQLFNHQEFDAPILKNLQSFGDHSRLSESMMFVPIGSGERRVAILSIQSYRRNAYGEEDLRTFQALAEHCSGALKRAHAEYTLQQNEDRYRAVSEQNRLLKKQLLFQSLEKPGAFTDFVTANEEMRIIFHHVESMAKTSEPVLITGETGVGKELLARAIHACSGRKGNFVPVNVAGLDDEMFSDTLFGHEKGAFTGAMKERRGLVETAAHGTLFLDEIGDLKLPSQVKLLRLLQEREYYQLGADKPKSTTARVVVATNLDLREQIPRGLFRKDLYYRLQTHQVHLPALRERPEDIPLLVDHFLRRAADQLGKKPPTPPRELYTLLSNYHFPGNVRELEAMIFDAVSKHRARVMSLEVIQKRVAAEHLSPEGITTLRFPDRLPTLKEMNELLVEEALRRTGNNQSQAARLLGMTQQALNQRLRRSENRYNKS